MKWSSPPVQTRIARHQYAVVWRYVLSMFIQRYLSMSIEFLVLFRKTAVYSILPFDL